MKRKLKPDVQVIWDKLGRSDILNDVFIQNEFHKRGLKIKDIDEVTLCFRATGKVHVHGHFSTESHSCEIAIMKHLIKNDIVDNNNNYIDNIHPFTCDHCEEKWETDYKCYKCSDKWDEDSQDFSGDVCKNCCNCQFNGS